MLFARAPQPKTPILMNFLSLLSPDSVESLRLVFSHHFGARYFTFMTVTEGESHDSAARASEPAAHLATVRSGWSGRGTPKKKLTVSCTPQKRYGPWCFLFLEDTACFVLVVVKGDQEENQTSFWGRPKKKTSHPYGRPNGASQKHKPARGGGGASFGGVP